MIERACFNAAESTFGALVHALQQPCRRDPNLVLLASRLNDDKALAGHRSTLALEAPLGLGTGRAIAPLLTPAGDTPGQRLLRERQAVAIVGQSLERQLRDGLPPEGLAASARAASACRALLDHCTLEGMRWRPLTVRTVLEVMAPVVDEARRLSDGTRPGGGTVRPPEVTQDRLVEVVVADLQRIARATLGGAQPQRSGPAVLLRAARLMDAKNCPAARALSEAAAAARASPAPAATPLARRHPTVRMVTVRRPPRTPAAPPRGTATGLTARSFESPVRAVRTSGDARQTVIHGTREMLAHFFGDPQPDGRRGEPR